VFLIGDRAYKLKKPVDLGFLDFRSEATRADVCRHEVELNRRLSPDVYLGTAEVVGDDGRSCDHLVVMKRMPEDRRLSTLIRSGCDVHDQLGRLARVIAAFHSRCERGAEISEQAGRDQVRARWVDSFNQVRPFHESLLDADIMAAVEELTLRFLDGREALFESRKREGYVVDGHGDLLTDDIFCLDDGPRVLDCLEFDDHLRYLDQLDDVAFLAMDLEHQGATELAAAFLAWYGEFSADPAPPSLLHHYLAYRAFVRAKVACLRFAQGDGDAAADARQLTALTHRHLATGRVVMTLVGGLPGAGKSTLAGGIADALGGCLLSTDRIRKELAGIDPTQSAAARYREGIYTPDWTERVYAELLDRAERLLRRGESVVLDGSWTDPRTRQQAADIAAGTSSELVCLRCDAPLDARLERIRHRRGVSDADASIAEAMGQTMTAWPDAHAVDTTTAVDASLSASLDVIRPHPAGAPWPLGTTSD
jgi:aminoglycoside phosphotransferase family enzyme/predicted kinase